VKVTLPSGPLQSRTGGSGGTTPHLRGAIAPVSIRHGDARVQANPVNGEPATSALVRPAHKLHRGFDMSPVFGQFDLALCFKVDGVPGSFGNGLGAVCFQQLSRIVMDFDFSHGAMLLSFCRDRELQSGSGTVDVDTYQAHTVCILALDVCKSPFQITAA
jgi:hypothetical protein